ncbi:hypothetical protein D9V34_10660 [Mycetocola lacteus]|uniref:Uncharacterized protein n=1 Tax=Mycetocola lacteus TaxID=76637 RepID=A0A3L7ARR7_9MICO|nr:hypothetical protein D9V34_10660 [Mycetocola lacteus]
MRDMWVWTIETGRWEPDDRQEQIEAEWTEYLRKFEASQADFNRQMGRSRSSRRRRWFRRNG